MAEGIPAGLQAQAELEGDPFRHAQPFPGLENLGAAIVDANGIPSGSPANYETLRGAGGDAAPADFDLPTLAQRIAADFAASMETGEPAVPPEPPAEPTQ